MRIADHAVAMQSSHALQQPSNTTHHQQIISPEAARAAAEVEAQRHAKQVAESDKTENHALRNEDRGKGNRGSAKEDAGPPRDENLEHSESMGASEPGKGEQVDLLA